LKELKKIRKAVDYFNEKYNPIKKAKICLLISESCIYNCPFKKEHDSIGEVISGQYFGTLSKLSCDNWRYTDFGLIPRNGIDLTASSKEVFEEFNQLVDIFKFSGRFTRLPFTTDVSDNYKLIWLFTERDNVNKLIYNSTFKSTNDDTVFADCFSEIIENDLQPIHSWIHGYALNEYTDYRDKIDLIESTKSIWKTDEGKRLEQILKTCKSQCWNCHECEKTFKTRLFDSGLQLNENLYNAIR
jgi:hypothetical protein